MDWRAKILEICEELGVDPVIIEDNETAQKIIAEGLGFKDYASFVAFPDPVAILDGRGAPLLDDHMSYQGMLGESCISEIGCQWNISRNVDDLQRQVIRFYKYIEENFQYEYAVVCDQILRKVLDGFELMDDEMGDIISKYGVTV